MPHAHCASSRNDIARAAARDLPTGAANALRGAGICCFRTLCVGTLVVVSRLVDCPDSLATCRAGTDDDIAHAGVRDLSSSFPQTVYGAGIHRFPFQKRSDELGVPKSGGHVQGGVTEPVLHRGVGAGLQQQLQSVRVALACTDDERRVADIVLHVDELPGTMVEEQTQHRQVRPRLRPHRRIAGKMQHRPAGQRVPLRQVERRSVSRPSLGRDLGTADMPTGQTCGRLAVIFVWEAGSDLYGNTRTESGGQHQQGDRSAPARLQHKTTVSCMGPLLAVISMGGWQ